jgi:tRNA-Thr(GGU) m(6)t(6)A37 methyltransferase TsaA
VKTIVAIGVVRSCFGGKFGVPRQPGLCPSAWGELVFHPEFRNPDLLRGIDGFSHLWLIFGFHATENHGWNPTVRPPRLGGNERIGVFASRSTFRPNGLGLSLVRLERLESGGPQGPVLHLSGLDLIDGTPVYDIKPYLPYADCVPDASAGFAAGSIPRLDVLVADEAAQAFEKLPENARNLIIEALSLDPRPAVQASEPDRVFGALLCGCNVRFTVNEGICRVVDCFKKVTNIRLSGNQNCLRFRSSPAIDAQALMDFGRLTAPSIVRRSEAWLPACGEWLAR